MGTVAIFIVCIFVFIYTMISRRMSASILTAPMIFLGIGYLLSKTGWFNAEHTEGTLHLVAEITLVVLLFLDASQTDLKSLKDDHVWPKHMLLIGLPLAMVIGTLAGMVFLPEWPIVVVALLAALLAPTDAALGQSVVSNEKVPERVRRGLVVESGLNDGLALPIILLFACFAAEGHSEASGNWLIFAAKQVILGPIAGSIVGWLGARIMIIADRNDWTSEVFEGIAALSLAGAAYLFADLIGGNGFIAAFVGGLTFGNNVKGRFKFVFEFTESEGQLLMWSAFLLLGLVLLPEAIEQLTLNIFGLIIVSLFLVRPLAIWLSLLGTDAANPTKFFFGWFGPRGLATALFALLVLDEINNEYGELILIIAINAVWISAILHGISGTPLGNIYAKLVEKVGKCPETNSIKAPFKE